MQYTMLHLGTSMKKVLSLIGVSQINEIRGPFPAQLARILLLIQPPLEILIEVFFFFFQLWFSWWLRRFFTPALFLLILIVFGVPFDLKLFLFFLLAFHILILTAFPRHIYLISRGLLLISHRTVPVELLVVDGRVRGISARLESHRGTLLLISQVALVVLVVHICRHLLKLLQVVWQRRAKISTINIRSGVWNRIINHDEIRIVLLLQRSLFLCGVFIWHGATSCIHSCTCCSRNVHVLILHIL